MLTYTIHVRQAASYQLLDAPRGLASKLNTEPFLEHIARASEEFLRTRMEQVLA